LKPGRSLHFILSTWETLECVEYRSDTIRFRFKKISYLSIEKRWREATVEAGRKRKDGEKWGDLGSILKIKLRDSAKRFDVICDLRMSSRH
jgi:hypothetical protein